MASARKLFFITGAVAILFLIALATSTDSVHPTSKDVTGQEWLSWGRAQRSVFIVGYIDGYLRGISRACNAADYLFEVDKPHTMSDRPSERCHGRMDLYSKDSDAYSTVLTDFYTKHAEYRNIPAAYLVWFLSDSQFKTAEELYQMASKGELRTNF